MITTTSGAPRRRLSLPELRAIAQPPEYSPSPTDQVYRAVSIYLSLLLARTRATPNGITLAWIAIGLGGVVLLLADAWAVRVVGALLLQLSYLLDFVDGEVARLTGRTSRVGGFLDLLGHGLIKTSLPLATGAAAARALDAPLFMLAGAVAALAIGVGDTLRFYAACTSGDLDSGDLGHTVSPREPGRRPVTLARLVKTALAQSFESPGLYALTLVGAAAGRLDLLTLYWLAAGPPWLVRRAIQYCRRLGASPEEP